MKAKAILTTALALAAFAAPAAIPTYAEDAPQTVYPSEFISELQFSSLTDYAISGDTYAFAEGTKLYILSTDSDGDRKLNSAEGFDCSVEIKNLDYDAEGNLYIGNALGDAFRYPDMSSAVDYTFPSGGDANVTIADYTYYLRKGLLECKHSADPEKDYVFGEDYSRLKSYGDKVYIIKDNTLYSLAGAEQTHVELGYTDFSVAAGIATGSTAQALAADYKLTKVIVKPRTAEGGNTYCTEIDLSDVSGNYFKTGRTFKQTSERTALAIAQTGNATVVVMRDEKGNAGCYLTLTTALETTEDAVSGTPDLTGTYYISEDTHLYSRPYMCGATQTESLNIGTEVTVLEKLNLDFADSAVTFYKVSCEKDGTTVEGYIAKNYLTVHHYAPENNPPDVIKDVEDNGTAVRNVLISLLIVVLVLVAVGYIVYTLTKGRDKKRTKNRK